MNSAPTFDWRRVVADLRASGLTLREIGEAAGLHVSSVCDLEQGRTTRPSFEVGSRLAAMHRRALGKARRLAAKKKAARK